MPHRRRSEADVSENLAGTNATEDDPGLQKAEGQDEWGFEPEEYPGYEEAGYRTRSEWGRHQEDLRLEHRMKAEARLARERRIAEEDAKRQEEEAAQKAEDEKRAKLRRDYLYERLGQARVKREKIAARLTAHEAKWPLGPEGFTGLMSGILSGTEPREATWMREHEVLKVKLDLAVQAVIDIEERLRY